MTGWWQVNGRSDKPMHLHADSQRTACGIPAHQLDLVAIGQGVESAHERGQPLAVAAWQGERQRRPSGHCTHRRQVTEIHCQRLVSKRFRIHIRKEMHTLHQSVYADRQMLTCWNPQQRTVVSHAKQHVVTGRCR